MSDKHKIYDYIKRTINPYGRPFEGTAYELGLKIMGYIENMDDEKENCWIPVKERLPEEHDSIFAKFKGTDNWKRGMFEKTSKYVIATVMFDDGIMLVEQAYTTDGIWRTDKKILGGTVVAWMDYPEPYKEG
jgi:N-methylhydantoinase B/oxoprolinase/acetone carboxylase alpha subunit